MKILVIGETCRDVFIHGTCARLCPEAPVPVLVSSNQLENVGMAGNVVENLKSLNPKVEVEILTQTNTITKRRYVDEASGYILLRVDENDEIPIPLPFRNFTRVFSADLDAVVISDYNKGFLSPQVLRGILEECNKHGVPTFVDTKKILGEWSKLAQFVKINCKEYNENERVLKLPPEYYCANVILTLGIDGSQWRARNQTIKSSTVEPVAVRDVSGAGDTFLAAFALKWLENQSVMRAMDYANKAARVAVSKRGVVAVREDEMGID